MKPLFSCVMPVKGARPYMDEALESLRLQNMGEDLEIIIQDGDVEPDMGQSDALNKGFAKAHGEWFFWLNADDVLLPGALEKVRRLILDGVGRKFDWIVGNTKYIDKNGVVTDVRQDARWYPWFGRRMTVWTGGPSSFFRRSLWERAGGLDVNFRLMMDIDLWTRWARGGERFVGLRDYLWGFRIHEGSLTMGIVDESCKDEERYRLLLKCGLRAQGFWRNVTRVAKILDGSWFRRMRDVRLCSGIHWKGDVP